MEKTRSAILRSALREVMGDGKDRKIPEMKEDVLIQKGLEYKKDYTEGNLAGVIRSMRLSGELIQTGRGSYIAGRMNNNRQTSLEEVEKKNHEGEMKTEECENRFVPLLIEIEHSIENQYRDFRSKIQNSCEVDLAQLTEDELEAAIRIVRIKKAYEDLWNTVKEK